MRDNEEKELIRAEIKSEAKTALPAESAQTADEHTTAQKQPQRNLGKLFITAALGGAITIYVCMFLFKYKRSDLLLMILMKAMNSLKKKSLCTISSFLLILPISSLRGTISVIVTEVMFRLWLMQVCSVPSGDLTPLQAISSAYMPSPV